MQDEVEKARREKAAQVQAERDEERRQFEADMRATRSHRVGQTLGGDPSFSLTNTYADFIGLLRSGDPIEQWFRDAMADALERGQVGGKGVRLRIEADGSFFKMVGNFEGREKLLNAGRHIARERNKGRSAGEIRQDLPVMFGIDDAEDYAKRAKRLYKQFQTWLEQNYTNDEVFGHRPTNDMHSYERVPVANDSDEGDEKDAEMTAHVEDDYFAEARSLFLQANSPEWAAAAATAPLPADIAEAMKRLGYGPDEFDRFAADHGDDLYGEE